MFGTEFGFTLFVGPKDLHRESVCEIIGSGDEWAVEVNARSVSLFDVGGGVVLLEIQASVVVCQDAAICRSLMLDGEQGLFLIHDGDGKVLSALRSLMLRIEEDVKERMIGGLELTSSS